MSAVGVYFRDADPVSPVQSIHSLRREHLGPLFLAIARFPEAWSVDWHEGYDGDMIALTGPADSDDSRFVISRTKAGFQLALNQSDEYEKLGTFQSFDELIAALAARTRYGIASDARVPSAVAPRS